MFCLQIVQNNINKNCPSPQLFLAICYSPGTPVFFFYLLKCSVVHCRRGKHKKSSELVNVETSYMYTRLCQVRLRIHVPKTVPSLMNIKIKVMAFSTCFNAASILQGVPIVIFSLA